MGKLGWTTYGQEIDVTIEGIDIDLENKANDPRIEAGVEFSVTGDAELFAAFSHVFSDDAEATGIGCHIKWSF